jgi:hypothetical protein
MVFAVNAVESGPNNFGAFQAKAMQLNGTATSTSTSSSPSATSTAKSAALHTRFDVRAGAGAVVLSAIVGSFLV